MGGPRSGEAVGPFLRRKFGRTAYRRLLGPLYGGLYASDPDRMPTRHALAQTLKHLGVRRSILWRMIHGAGEAAGAPPCSFREGLGALPLALSQRLAGRVRLGCPVRGVRRDADQWEISVDDHGERVDEVVLACPADAAAEILKVESPRLAAALGSLNYNPLALVHMTSEAALRGLGYQVAFGEAFETRGVTCNHSIFGRSGLYTAYLGGMRNPDFPALADEVIGATACREFEKVTGHSARTLMVFEDEDASVGRELGRPWEGRPTARTVDLLQLHGSTGYLRPNRGGEAPRPESRRELWSTGPPRGGGVIDVRLAPSPRR